MVEIKPFYQWLGSFKIFLLSLSRLVGGDGGFEGGRCLCGVDG